MTVSQISCQQAHEIITDGNCQVVDIRDPSSYLNGHPTGAISLSNDNIQQFLTDADKNKPTLVFCYHGISSQQAAAMLNQQGFDQVFSVDGGAEAWQAQFPDSTVTGTESL